MRSMVPTTAWFFLLAPVLMLAQEPVVGLYEYPVPALPAVINAEFGAAEGWAAPVAVDDAPYFDEAEDWEEVDELNEGELDDEGEGRMVDEPSFRLRFYRRELPSGIYAWQIIEEKMLPDGSVEVCRTWRDEGGPLERTCTIEPAGQWSGDFFIDGEHLLE